MIRPVFAATVRERLTSVVTLILLGVLVLLPLVVLRDNLTSGGSLLSSLGLVLVLGTGCIGREISAGSLALVFCRPIRRSDYVLTKWLTIAMLAFVFGLVQLGAQEALCAYLGSSIPLHSLAQNLFERATVCLGASAVVVLFSTFCPRSSDVVLWCVAALGAKIAGDIEKPTVSWIGKELYTQLAPQLSYTHVFQSQPIVWSALCGYVASVCLALALACWLLGRKELSYAA